MASLSKVLYIGFTNGLEGRVHAHKTKFFKESFTAQYNVNRLVYFEEHESVFDAITREKQLKNWHRQWKINLIESTNSEWKDLSEGWFPSIPHKDRGDPETSSG